MKRVLLLQIVVFLFGWLFFGIEFTKPVDITSADWPILSQGMNFSIHIPAIYLLFLGVTIAPFAEELQFRGPFWMGIRHGGFANFLEQHWAYFWLIVVASGLIFGLLHTNYSMPWRLFAAFFGATSVWLVLRYKKLWPTILMHYGWNIFLASVEFFLSPYIREDLARMITFN